MRRANLALIVLALLTSGCQTFLHQRPPRYRVIAYVFGGRADYQRIGAHKLTHINYAFGLVSPDGEVVLSDPDGPGHLAQLQALKARNPRLKIILSVGGWGADNFSDAALTDASRETFAASAMALMKRYALDGIDLDWEYPGQPGPGIKFRAEDKQNFTLMLRTMRRHLDTLSDERRRVGYDRYTLSIASSAGDYFEHTEMGKLHVDLDWINIMTYDFVGSWSETTGHHAGLYESKANPQPSVSADRFVRQHLEAGIPRRKLVLGAAFYGRAWTGVEAENTGLYQPYTKSVDDEFPFSRLLLEFVDKQGFRRHWDRSVRAPFLWNSESGTFITYDDPESLREKTRFVKQQRLGGMMFWEYSHDPEEILLDVLHHNLR